MTAPLPALVWRCCARWVLLCLCLPGLVWAQASTPGSSALLPVPALSARVVDQAGALSPDQQASLEGRLDSFEREHGTQIVVLLVPSTQPEDIAAFAFRVADSWKIGRREVGDGLLLVVALKDHRSRIEVARALEGAIPDVQAGRILTETLAPALRAGDVAGGLDQTLGRLMALVQSGGAQAAPADPAATRVATPGAGGDLAAQNLPWWLWPVLLAVLLGMVIVRAWLGPFPGALLMGGVTGLGGALWGGTQLGLVVGGCIALVTLVGLGNVLMTVISSGLGGGSGGGSGGGGGFSSGGGGSFGGGGASGSW